MAQDENGLKTNGVGYGHDPLIKLTRKDFVSDQEVRWCPGCGDYAILAQMQKVMPELGVPREKMVFVSGIGCSSRFPYYMNTYGFHSIHGRAPAMATGIKSANPDLYVWVITGDGDALSIGGNHLMHMLRRNVDIKVVLFNNRIYGLTKGQYSPTSEFGKKTKSTPMGSIDYPLSPISVALGAEATFVARSVDRDTHHLSMIIERAARHKGSAFVEVFQNCNIFNDGAFEPFVDKPVRDDRMIYLEHGQALVFGKEHDKGIRWSKQGLEVVALGNGFTKNDLWVHDEQMLNPSPAFLLAHMDYPDYPVPVGVFRAVERPSYEDLLEQQIRHAIQQRGPGDLSKLLQGSETWTIE